MKRLVVTSAILLAAVACGDDHEHRSNLTVGISGEGAALTGFAFPPARNGLSFVDGWEVRFERILVTVDDIVLTDMPDMNPTDQSQTGPIVARAKGPWAVDMSKPGATMDITPKVKPLAGGHGHDHGHGGDGNAQILTRLDGLDGDRSFDPSVRYGFGFDIVTAAPDAIRTNLDGVAAADYEEMVAKGLSVLYVGTATFKGTKCESSDPDYQGFESLPKTVRFRFGFKTPTKYANCQNTNLRGKPFDGEEAQRGVQMSEHGSTYAQITLHVDHPFWSTVDHDAAELYFDQMAAAASLDGTLVIDDLTALDFTSFKDKAGNDLPWRSCIADKPVKQGVRRFDPGSVPVNPMASPDTALRNYADFVAYQQSTQGHLNADGLCAVTRLFPAPR